MPVGWAWNPFVESWLGTNVHLVFYEALIKSPRQVLSYLLNSLHLPCSFLRIERALRRQEINRRRSELEGSGDRYPYSSGIQSKNLRVGKVDDWMNYLTPEQNLQAQTYFGEMMKAYGYVA